jgi:hypothetical protein
VGLYDAILKQLVADDTVAFVSWLLDTEVAAVEMLTVELPAEALRADTGARVRL